MFRNVLFRLRAFFRVSTVESDLDDELRWHVDQEVHKHLRSGSHASRRRTTRHSDVLTPILSPGVALAAIGIAAGVLLAAAAASMIASVLYGVRPHDPIVFATVPVLLLTFAAVASYLPARRATQIDPMRALRES